jgi:hypothetical protein
MMNTTPPSVAFDPVLFAHVMQQYRETSPHDPAHQWLLLETLHVVSQTRFIPRLKVHDLMLHLAWRTRDWAEVGGQMLRLLLVPLGHLTGRLPLGNSGRSDINPFKPMPLRRDLSDVIAQARQAIASAEQCCP